METTAHISRLSVIVPCFNEEQVLQSTHERLSRTLARLSLDYEIIYVDDGSTDQTSAILHRLQQQDERVRVLAFSRNFGHQVAVTAGVDNAGGDAVVLIDADLQDPPELIAEMVARWREGFNVVYGLRTDRDGETAFKIWTARLFYRLINVLSEVAIPLDTGDFRLMDRQVIEALRRMPERDRFVRGMVSWLGFRQVALPYRRAARTAGQTKYPLKKMVRLALDGILSFSVLPLRLATYVGLLSFAAGILAGLFSIVRLLIGQPSAPWTGVLIMVLLLGGLQLVCTGIIGEYLGRTYMESKRRPLYVLKDRLGFGGEK